MKEHLEYQSYLYECIGEKNVSDKVGENDLFTVATASALKEVKNLSADERLFNQAFDLALELISENPKLYQIAIDAKKQLYSYKFHYWGSCLFNTWHGKKAKRGSENDIQEQTSTVLTRVKRSTKNTVETPTKNNTNSQQENIGEKEKEIENLKQLLRAKEQEIAASAEKTKLELEFLRKKEEDIRQELEKKENELSKFKDENENIKKKEQALSEEVQAKKAAIERLERDLAIASQKKEDDFF